ncbi:MULTISPECIES: DEAD/DEAH box helicase [unclassified Sulfitobacter]|uniref:DEAD/DEAH box helicase n=1 Tax=unclassified Sulfitobacter TaxID=196795 RepID=UPI0010AD371A|nr:DEAD/DEAH box helicase [Sulfitobacter sp. 15WGC]TKA86195.1 DEAD/DEAH box helicase [Sulfitobacter sp. 15WGC]
MYDPTTAALIRSTPELDDLDTEALPDQLARAFAEIVSARVMLREGDEDLASLSETTSFARRLAQTNEALVAINPDRENRAAAGFVAASAYQLLYQAQALKEPEPPASFITPDGISPEISAMLLFLVAEASADAAEVAAAMRVPSGNRLQSELILHLIMLAKGQVGRIRNRKRPPQDDLVTGSGGERANAALYYRILRGIRALAFVLQGRRMRGLVDPIEVFTEVKDLAAPGAEEFADEYPDGVVAVFPGPFHLASLLIAAGSALLGGAVVKLPPPEGVDGDRWAKAMKTVSETRPYLWRNHRDAVEQGYLEIGTSSAIGFPTGAGKSTTAQLKIHATLLSGRKAVFLAPTHALVDQTTRDLRDAFPRATVRGERTDEFGFSSQGEDLPDVMVMTPEACLLSSHMEPERFDDVGLLIFDECHLMHPSTDGDRRAIDAMLCILGFTRVAPDADIVLLSAMMKNTDELSGWLEELTGRKSLPLDNAWKPTRQLRGCVVYDANRYANLQNFLKAERRKKPTGGVPVAVKRKLTATPRGFFSVKQTWASQIRSDYTLVPLLDTALEFSTNKFWKLTPNSGIVASSIAVAAARAGLRTLVFSQSIPNAFSISEKARMALDDCAVELTENEQRFYEVSADEMGGADQLYLTLENGKLVSQAATHHGQLLPEERQLAEALYKRDGALSVLAATPTLGQGMNLPADLVIIAEDSQYDAASGRKDLLEAEDLLNAAGRAGRAGESATGIVLVVPGQVVPLDDTENKIGGRWTRLRAIFGQSDQCLILDDPFTALMDRIHDKASDIGDLERYVVARLAETDQSEDGVLDVRLGLSRSFAAYRKRQDAEEDWIESRTAAALSLLNDDDEALPVESLSLRNTASMLGLPEDVLKDLSNALAEEGFHSFHSVEALCNWMFEWLTAKPEYLDRVIKPDSLEYLFGTDFKKLKGDAARASHALPKLREALSLWMNGEPLRAIQKALSDKTRDRKRSTSARKFVIRLVPDLAHLMGAPLHILQGHLNVHADEQISPTTALGLANRCVRRGFSSAEMAAFGTLMSSVRWSRREVHRSFANITPYLQPAGEHETLERLELRVELASDEELNNRTYPDPFQDGL